MPRAVAGHCLVALNNAEVMSIGGIGGNNRSLSETWIYNMNSDAWDEGKPMLSSRFYHGCSTITDKDGHNYIIVAGGLVGEYYWSDDDRDWYGDYITTESVEIYDPMTNNWSVADKLPKGISGGKLIEDGRGGVLMIGGDAVGHTGYTSDIFYLHGKDGTWKKTFKTMNNPSEFHVAMLIPDSFVWC